MTSNNTKLSSIFESAKDINTQLKQFKKKLDGIWRVKPSDLKFDDPPVVIGRGTFGLVLLSTYRGTTVAVKRVIPPKCKSLLAYCLSRSLKTYVLIIPCLY